MCLGLYDRRGPFFLRLWRSVCPEGEPVCLLSGMAVCYFASLSFPSFLFFRRPDLAACLGSWPCVRAFTRARASCCLAQPPGRRSVFSWISGLSLLSTVPRPERGKRWVTGAIPVLAALRPLYSRLWRDFRRSRSFSWFFWWSPRGRIFRPGVRGTLEGSSFGPEARLAQFSTCCNCAD